MSYYDRDDWHCYIGEKRPSRISTPPSLEEELYWYKKEYNKALNLIEKLELQLKNQNQQKNYDPWVIGQACGKWFEGKIQDSRFLNIEVD